MVHSSMQYKKFKLAPPLPPIKQEMGRQRELTSSKWPPELGFDPGPAAVTTVASAYGAPALRYVFNDL